MMKLKWIWSLGLCGWLTACTHAAEPAPAASSSYEAPSDDGPRPKAPVEAGKFDGETDAGVRTASQGDDSAAAPVSSGPATDPGLAPTNPPDGAGPSSNPVSIASLEAEGLETQGPHASSVDMPFEGVGLYANGDGLSFPFTFPHLPGVYRVDVVGASSSASTAQVELFVGSNSRASFGFTGTEVSVSSAQLIFREGSPAMETISLRTLGDDGSWDAYIDSIEIWYLGAPLPPPPPPEPDAVAVAESGKYRNLFVELGKSEAEVDARVNQVVEQLFYGDEDERLYYETGEDEAYFYTADTDDVRSEGMSYAMMISVQLDKQTEFNRLWKFSKTHMQHAEGDRLGYFAWRVRTDGTHMDGNPAPDGEEYFAMALLMAAKRWGNGAGLYDYEAEANLILNHMVNHRTLAGLPEWSGIANMIDPVEKQIVFSIEGNSASFTDPSYHLPHFYELFARWAGQDNQLWLEVADRSRQLFRDACHPTTGLAPDYCEFDGTPTGGTHAQFRFDAWRVAMNIALDSYWWNRDPWQRETWVKNYLNFFAGQGVSTHRNQFNIDGSGAEGDHSPGLVAMNAVAALISDDAVAWEFVEEFWKANPTTGNYRYYDGCLYLFGLLNVTGRYRMLGVH